MLGVVNFKVNTNLLLFEGQVKNIFLKLPILCIVNLLFDYTCISLYPYTFLSLLQAPRQTQNAIDKGERVWRITGNK